MQSRYATKEEFLNLASTVGELMLQITEVKAAVEQLAPPMVQRPEPIQEAVERSAFDDAHPQSESGNSPRESDPDEESKDEEPEFRKSSGRQAKARKHRDRPATRERTKEPIEDRENLRQLRLRARSPIKQHRQTRAELIESLALLTAEEKVEVIRLEQE